MGAADTWAADAPDASATGTSDRVHVAQFYGDDAFLVDAVTRFIGAGLGAGEAGVVIATRPHREAVEERLRARGVDVAIAREQGRYLTLDAAETLSQVLVDGWPDAELFESLVARLSPTATPPQGLRLH